MIVYFLLEILIWRDYTKNTLKLGNLGIHIRYGVNGLTLLVKLDLDYNWVTLIWVSE